MCINNNIAAIFMPNLDDIICPDRSEPHSENKHFKSSLFVILQTDLTKHEFRLFTNRQHDVVISASF